MTTYSRLLGIIFGGVMLLLAVLITLETLIRKFLSLSLGGVDELGGYAIAIAAPLAFCVAMVEQSHIRINLLHMRLPSTTQAVLNALAAISMGLLAAFLPQAVWLVAMTAFSVAAAFLSGKALLLLLKRDWTSLNRQFGPSSVSEELEAELADLDQRDGGKP